MMGLWPCWAVTTIKRFSVLPGMESVPEIAGRKIHAVTPGDESKLGRLTCSGKTPPFDT